VELNSLTEAVIGASFEVSNTLGAGFLELYERALVSELTLRGIAVVTQAVYRVAYKGQTIGETCCTI
jgi:GxxExxY protein